MKIFLASKSPRRQELLQVITPDFEIKVSPVDERAIESEILKEDGDMLSKSQKLVLKLSLEKAKAVYVELKASGENIDDILVIGSDTCVVAPDEIMGKPEDKSDARRMLTKLSMGDHYVLTGVCIYTSNGIENFYEASSVRFNSLDEYQERRIEEYINTDEPYDKAGAYGIQGRGMLLIEEIKGDYYNIMGLPVSSLAKKMDKYLR